MNLAIYIIGMLAFISGFYFVKKSETKWNGVGGFFVACVVWMMIQSLVGEINVLLHYPVHAWQYGLLGLGIGIYWWIRILQKKETQEYEYAMVDLLMVILLVVLAWGWSRYQFGEGLKDFNYRSVVDSARHLCFARSLREGIVLNKMIFAAVNTAVWMSALEGIVTTFYQYKIFIVFDLAVFVMNGMLFWVAIRRYLNSRWMKGIGVIFAILFVCGHPMNSMVYGTSYLGTGILLTLCIYHFAMMLIKKEIESEWGKIFLALAMIGLYYSYVLFVPAFIFGTLIYLFYYKKVEKKEITAKLLHRSYILWGSLFVLGVIYLYLFFVTGDAVIFSDLNQTGLMYGHPYADYLFLFPFLLHSFWTVWKEKKISLAQLLFLLELGLVIVMGLGSINGRVSVYYYYKSYASLWGMAFVVMVEHFHGLSREKKQLCSTWLITWSLMLVLFLTDAENHMYQKRATYGKLSAAQACFPMYGANLSLVRELDDKEDLIELIMAAAKFSADHDILIPYITNKRDFDVLYYGLAGQYTEWKFEFVAKEDPIGELIENYEYIVVVWDDDITREALRDLQVEEVIFENEAGYFAKIGG